MGKRNQRFENSATNRPFFDTYMLEGGIFMMYTDIFMFTHHQTGRRAPEKGGSFAG